MICRKLADGTLVFLRDDQETEVMRVKLPDDGVTLEELEQFLDHVKKLARRAAMRKRYGPS